MKTVKSAGSMEMPANVNYRTKTALTQQSILEKTGCLQSLPHVSFRTVLHRPDVLRGSEAISKYAEEIASGGNTPPSQ